MPSAPPDVAFLARYRPLILSDMRAAFNAATAHDPALPLYDMLRYHLGWGDGEHATGGKLLRPSLLLLCCEALGGQADAALPAASAIELLHNFTLIHDDIEDRSDLRHGRPTVWRRWETPLAVNAGDGLWAIARVAMHRLGGAGVAPGRALAAMRVLDEACLLLCEGQDRDLRFEGDTSTGVDDYLAMIRGKTGALMAAAAAIGSILAGGAEAAVAAFREYGLRLGVAFQIRDDALGVWGDAKRTGKTSAEDLRQRKLSYPVVYALTHANPGDRQALAERYAHPMDDDGVALALAVLDRAGARDAAERLAGDSAAGAVAAIAALPLDTARRDELAALARFAASRTL